MLYRRGGLFSRSLRRYRIDTPRFNTNSAPPLKDQFSGAVRVLNTYAQLLSVGVIAIGAIGAGAYYAADAKRKVEVMAERNKAMEQETKRKVEVMAERNKAMEQETKRKVEVMAERNKVMEQETKRKVEVLEQEAQRRVAEAELRVAEKFLMYGYAEEYAKYRKKPPAEK